MQAFGFGDGREAPASAVTRESFCGRLGNACVGVVIGIGLLFGSVILLGWNEFNFVRNENVLKLVDDEVIESTCAPDARNDGKPVWVSCVVQKAYDFHDDSHCPSLLASDHHKANSAWFQVDSQIYQWVESYRTEKHVTPTGDKITEKFFEYRKTWVHSPVDSSKFYCAVNHDTKHCPAWPEYTDLKNEGSIPKTMQSRTQRAPEYSVGIGSFPPNDQQMYHLHGPLLESIKSRRPAEIESQPVSPIPTKKVYDQGDGKVVFADTSAESTVGDVRAQMYLANVLPGTTTLSVIALQRDSAMGKRFGTWDTDLEGTMSSVAWLVEGAATKDEMIAQQRSVNSSQVVLLRLVGWLLMFVGMQMIVGPVALAPEAIPCVGQLIGGVVGGVLCLFNFCASAALSLVIIGLAWLSARPVLGLGLLALACACVVAGAHVRRKALARSPRVGYPAAVNRADLQQPWA